MSRAVGIDLGTTNSLVAFVEAGLPQVIAGDEGDVLLPSVVSVSSSGVVHVGREAERRLLTDAARTVYSVKRFMGRGLEDVHEEARLLPFAVRGAPAAAAGGVVRIGLIEREFTPPEISAFILRELKTRAEAFFTTRGDVDPVVDSAVITVPAYFNDAQRTATRDAGRLAGLDVLRILNEPTAASLAYGLDTRHDGLIAVYDFGGGTFDISILRVEDGIFQVLATNGDTRLGGDDIDRLLTDLVLSELTGRGSPWTPEFVQSVRAAVIRAKWDLSTHDAAAIRIGAYARSIARDEFESLIGPIVERTMAPCRQALSDAGIEASQIDAVVMVGGSTRIPLVRRRAAELFGRLPFTEINPDEVVAIGAALQADILMTGNRDRLLLDVTPLSLGIETMGGTVSKIIRRNSTIPASGTDAFTTAVDNQTAVDIHVLQGERELVADNRSLARFTLRGIPPLPAGLPRVQVQFQIDANGILSVTATELRTGVEQQVEVRPSYGLTDEEIERMLVDSFEHAEADIAARQLIDFRREAEEVVHATEKTLSAPSFTEMAAELEPGEQKRIEQALAGLKHVLGSSDPRAIRQWTGVLNEATRHLAEVQVNRSVQAALAGRRIDHLQ
jgi:Fe-S protein assembly chaperone HscA